MEALKMTRIRRIIEIAFAMSIISICQTTAYAETAEIELKVLKVLKIGGEGRWDLALVDPASNRLYITRGTHLQVIDGDAGKVVGDVGDLQRAHGTAIVPDKNLGFVTSGGENAVAVFDLKTLQIVRKVKTEGNGGRNPDAITYDPASKKVFAFCGGGDAVVIDPTDLNAPIAAVPCGGKLEIGQADGEGHVFVNDEDKSVIIVIDSKSLKVVDRWPIAPASGPSGLGLDAAHHRLFSVGSNQKMAIVDYQNGKLLATVPIGNGVDGCAFDPQLGVALSANGADGTVTVVREITPGEFSAVQTLDTLKSGRTITNNPATSRFFIPATIPVEGETPAQFGIVVIGKADVH
jgi:DNA-binding beta-propeller fold protein YncE